MRLDDFKKKIFEDFDGIYDRGNNDQVPEKNFIDALNIDYEVGECGTRAGLIPSILLNYGAGNGKVRRTANFLHPTGYITLILDDAGNLYTFSNRANDSATTPRMTIAGATDFAAIQMLGKIFISFHNGKTGIAGVNLKVFIPAVDPVNDEFRDAGGEPPTPAIPMDALDGFDTGSSNVLLGNYLIAVTFVTSSGNYTPPGPVISSIFTPTFYFAPGGKQIWLFNVPIGPPGTTKRQILITEPNLTEYFFLPEAFGGIIPDNVTTTAVLNFNSITDLQDSADYLFDLLATIPSGVGLEEYNARLAIWGEPEDTSIVRFSNSGRPEELDGVDNIVVVNKDSGFAVRSAVVIRNVFYACTQKGIYGIVDNEDIPANWKPIPIDRSTNVPCHGVASFFSQSGIKFAREWTLIVDVSGILYMDGSVRKPPITDGINDIWKRINHAQYHKILLVADETAHKLYCALPLDESLENNVILMADYNVCAGKVPSLNGIKWAVWKLYPGNIERGATDISMTLVYPEDNPTLKIGSVSGGGKIWKFDVDLAGKDDSSLYNFESYFKTSLLYWISGYIHTFVAASMRIFGEGIVLPSVEGLDGTFPTDLQDANMINYEGKSILFKCNYQSERAAFKFRVRQGKFKISDFVIYGKPTSPMRPQ